MTAVVVGVDAGNSKTDVAVAAMDGSVLALHQGPGSSPDKLGDDAAAGVLDGVIATALTKAGAPAEAVASIAVFAAGLDLPEDAPRYRAALERALPYRASISTDNDTVAALLAGTGGEPGVVVVCGAGINAMLLAHDGRRHGYLSLGQVSGDWGGGLSLGREVLWSAVRAEDGRGRATGLVGLVLDAFAVDSVAELSMRIRRGEVAEAALVDLVPGLYRLAGEGDFVASRVVERLVDEVTGMVAALVRRAPDLPDQFPLVLAGGALTHAPAWFIEALTAQLRSVAPSAQVRPLRHKPVAGALLAALAEDGRDGYGARVLADTAVRTSGR